MFVMGYKSVMLLHLTNCSVLEVGCKVLCYKHTKYLTTKMGAKRSLFSKIVSKQKCPFRWSASLLASNDYSVF